MSSGGVFWHSRSPWGGGLCCLFRQCDSSGLLTKAGGHVFVTPVRGSPTDSSVGGGLGSLASSSVHLGGIDCGGGRPVQVQPDASSEWTLHQDMVRCLLRRWPATINLFATSMDFCLPTYFAPRSDPMSAGTDAFLSSWDRLQAYAFPHSR